MQTIDWIRAIWSKQLKQCNQQYDQNNTIKTIQSVIESKQSKQYGQQYNQNKPGGGYIVSCTYVKTKNPSKSMIRNKNLI